MTDDSKAIVSLARDQGVLEGRVEEIDKDLQDHEERIETVEKELADWREAARRIRRDVWFGVVMILIGILISQPQAHATILMIAGSIWKWIQLWQGSGGRP